MVVQFPSMKHNLLWCGVVLDYEAISYQYFVETGNRKRLGVEKFKSRECLIVETVEALKS